MPPRRRFLLPLILGMFVVTTPVLSLAQPVVTGLVTSATGEKLAGVTVEVASPELIEATRTTVTDESGRYRIDDLRPGPYSVTFERNGFKRLRLDDVELTGARTAVVDAQLDAGSSLETVVATATLPSIDRRSAARQITLDRDVLRAIPTTNNYNALLTLVPGVSTTNDVMLDPLPANFPIHGGRLTEGRLLVDGMYVGSAPNDNQPAHYLADVYNAAEVAFTISGALGEAETSGLAVNIVPDRGGSSLRGSVYSSGNSEAMWGDNITEEMRSFGITAAPPYAAWDLNGAVGGALARDRAWFFVAGRTQRLTREIPFLYFNRNAGDPSRWLYEADLTRPAYSDRTWDNASGRVTLRAARHRFGIFHDEQAICRGCDGATAETGLPDRTISPEAQGVGDIRGQRLQQLSWTAHAGSRWSFDAGVTRHAYGWGNSERADNARDLVRVLGQTSTFGGTAIVYRSQDWADHRTSSTKWRASAAAFWRGHALELGYQGLRAADDRTLHSNDQSVSYRFSNGIPNQITQVVSPFTVLARLAQTSAYLQDEWTLGRITLQGAVRFDHVRSWFPEQRIGPALFVPSPIAVPETPGVDAYQDLTPRAGVAYDVTGGGTTVLKASAGKYLAPAGTSGIYYDPNPLLQFGRSSNRSWIDFNGNNVADCDLNNPGAQNLASSGGDSCGPHTNTVFLQFATFRTFDPDLLSGSGVRPSDGNIAASIEHQILPRASVALGYFRRWFDGFAVVDNLAVTPDNVRAFNVTAPRDPSLPGGGGHTIGPLFTPTTSPALSLFMTAPASKYGNWLRYSDSIDLVFEGRTGFGLTMMGGSSSTRLVNDSCEIRAALPETALADPYCRTSTGYRTQLRGLASYLVPAIDLQIGAVYQNEPGPALTAISTVFAFPVSAIVNLIPPETAHGERITQLDVRVAKVLRIGRTRSAVGIDLFNVLNSSSAVSYVGTYQFSNFSSVPRSVLPPRLLRITAAVTF